MRKNGTVMRSMTQGVECWQLMMFVLRQTIGYITHATRYPLLIHIRFSSRSPDINLRKPDLRSCWATTEKATSYISGTSYSSLNLVCLSASPFLVVHQLLIGQCELKQSHLTVYKFLHIQLLISHLFDMSYQFRFADFAIHIFPIMIGILSENLALRDTNPDCPNLALLLYYLLIYFRLLNWHGIFFEGVR